MKDGCSSFRIVFNVEIFSFGFWTLNTCYHKVKEGFKFGALWNTYQHKGFFLEYKELVFSSYTRRADKSLAWLGRKQARKYVRDARDFNNIATRALIKFFSPPQGKASKEIHAILRETLACFLPGRAKDLSAPPVTYLPNTIWTIYVLLSYILVYTPVQHSWFMALKIIIIIIIESIIPSRNIGCLWVLSTSVYRLLRTLVHSSFYPLP